jgi:Domain of unknown function (DUF5916)/Carbohydrate family 9 binding domain-like
MSVTSSLASESVQEPYCPGARPLLPRVGPSSLLLFGALLAARPVLAQEGNTSQDVYQIPAVRVTERPRIDGVLDDAVWGRAPAITDFIQQEPDEGRPATERTEVRVLYDGTSLFIGVRAFDSSPNAVVATEMRRDGDRILEEDNFEVILDTFMDSRSAYMFVVNPLGAQLDQQVFDEGGRDRRGSVGAINKDWDGVWSVSAKVLEDGWIAEIEIPMITLRFPSANPQSWGINFMRNIRRKNEQAFWAPIPRQFGLTRVSLAGSLRNLESLDRGHDLRVKPYVTGGGRYQKDQGISDTSTNGDVGLDLKYGVTPSLNLDVTVNTDFAQAEVDDERVNLTRFPLFFPEKREFFLDYAGQFAVGTPNSTGRIADLFFSRRIGLTDAGQHVPIIGGGRLTGKVGSNNIAVLDLQTDNAFGAPGENFLVTRYTRDVFGRSQLGGLFINRQADSGGHYNRTYAADMNLIVTPSVTIDGFLAATSTPGVSGGNFAGHIRAGLLNQKWRVYGEFEDFGDNFNPETGFVPWVGIRRTKLHVERNPRPGKWGVRFMEPMTYLLYVTDQSGRMVQWQNHLMIGIRFDDGSYLRAIHNENFDRIDVPFRVGGVTVDPADYRYHEWGFSFNTNPARRLAFNGSFGPQTYYGGKRTDLSGGVALRVTNQLATNASFSRNDVRLPNGKFKADIGSLQVDYAFSPTMSLRSLTQYNSQTDQWSESARLRYIFRPGSDIYVVYDEIRRDTQLTLSPLVVNEFRDRQLILKMTYLLSF